MNKDKRVLKFNSKYSMLDGFKVVEVYNKSLVRFACKHSMDYKTVIDSIPNGSDRDKFNDMIVIDFIVENWDRHFSNFGFVINNDTQEIIEFAPIFDNGYSLMCKDSQSDFVDRDYLNYSKVNTFKLVTN